jgi:eukaryotic-like serine/threonine-protein kinase
MVQQPDPRSFGSLISKSDRCVRVTHESDKHLIFVDGTNPWATARAPLDSLDSRRDSMIPVPAHQPSSTIADDPLEGTAYRALALPRLGRGSMGEVLEAEHVALGKRVAVKLLHAELSRSSEGAVLIERLRLEAQIARVVHPNLVAITDVGTTPGGRHFLVMERLRGRTLRDELARRGHLPIAEAVTLQRQLLAGLGAIHRAGIVHRDIKLENLFLCDAVEGGERMLKILDFGIAKIVDVEMHPDAPAPLALATREGLAIGTPRFLAPEQAMGKAVDARADLYAAGIVLYMLLAGRDPFFELRSFLDLLRAHVTEPPRPPSLLAPQPVSPALDAVVLKAITKSPDQRFSSAAEFSEALSAATHAASPRWLRTEPLVDTRCAAPAAAGIDLEATTAAAPIVPGRTHVSTFTAAFILLLGGLVSVGLTGLLVHVFR